jgi:hypothetical protein
MWEPKNKELLHFPHGEAHENNSALNPKQQRLVKRLPLAASVAEAGREAGYNTKQATYKAPALFGGDS